MHPSRCIALRQASSGSSSLRRETDTSQHPHTHMDPLYFVATAEARDRKHHSIDVANTHTMKFAPDTSTTSLRSSLEQQDERTTERDRRSARVPELRGSIQSLVRHNGSGSGSSNTVADVGCRCESIVASYTHDCAHLHTHDRLPTTSGSLWTEHQRGRLPSFSTAQHEWFRRRRRRRRRHESQ